MHTDHGMPPKEHVPLEKFRDAKPVEKQRHIESIRDIVEKVGRPVDEIVLVYEDTFESMKANAKVHDFLPILVSKKIKKMYK